jgi:hypothetical protein
VQPQINADTHRYKKTRAPWISNLSAFFYYGFALIIVFLAPWRLGGSFVVFIRVYLRLSAVVW